MNQRAGEPASFDRFRAVKPKAIRLSKDELIRTEYFNAEERLPLVVVPKTDDLRLADWGRDNQGFIETSLITHGAILFRDFVVESVIEFQEFARSLTSDLLDYRERAAPRTEVTKKIFTSTEFPADQIIPLHHEMSYSHNWPTKIWFFCAQPALKGGRTPIASDRQVFGRINPDVKAEFIRKRVMYIRNYGEGVDLSWQEAFQTDNRAVVEKYCREAHTDFEWREGGRLRTRQVRQAVATHPKTGETVWFNHAHLFHVSNLPAPVRESLLAEFEEDELPRNAFYGDGTAIETSVLEEIRTIYREASVSFPWQKTDVLMIDNFLVSHGRESFVGPRSILVAMAELYTNPNL